MEFQKLVFTENQVEAYKTPRVRGLLKRKDAHVFAMVENETIHAMVIITMGMAEPRTYVIQHMYLKEGTNKECLKELIQKVEETCQSVETEFIACHLQGDPLEMESYVDLLTEQAYECAQVGHSVIYSLEEVMDCRLMEFIAEAKDLISYVKPYKDLTKEQKNKLSVMIEESEKYMIRKAPDPEFGLAVVVKDQIIAFVDAKKIDDSVIFVPNIFLWKHKLSEYARAMAMMYMIDKAQKEMAKDTVFCCETYNESTYKQYFDWFGMPEADDYIVEFLKAL